MLFRRWTPSFECSSRNSREGKQLLECMIFTVSSRAREESWATSPSVCDSQIGRTNGGGSTSRRYRMRLCIIFDVSLLKSLNMKAR